MQILPSDLKLAIESVYIPLGLELTSKPDEEKESHEYSAYRFEINNKKVVYRAAKTTPTKAGQFVTIWKRPTSNAEIVPFDTNDDIDFIVVSVSDKTHNHFGQFVFSREILIKKGLMSSHGKRGKLAFRVYGPWVETRIPSAVQAQKWQLDYFFNIHLELDARRIKGLFGIMNDPGDRETTL
jgi:hypothetical protein